MDVREMRNHVMNREFYELYISLVENFSVEELKQLSICYINKSNLTNEQMDILGEILKALSDKFTNKEIFE